MLVTARIVLWSATGIILKWFVCVHVCGYSRAFEHAFVAVVHVKIGASVSFLLGCISLLGLKENHILQVSLPKSTR